MLSFVGCHFITTFNRTTTNHKCWFGSKTTFLCQIFWSFQGQNRLSAFLTTLKLPILFAISPRKIILWTSDSWTFGFLGYFLSSTRTNPFRSLPSLSLCGSGWQDGPKWHTGFALSIGNFPKRRVQKKQNKSWKPSPSCDLSNANVWSFLWWFLW